MYFFIDKCAVIHELKISNCQFGNIGTTITKELNLDPVIISIALGIHN